MITVEHICETCRVARRNSGLWTAFSSLSHREYETVHALEDISFHIREGGIVDYIGPNGAGKSSTIKIMSDSFRWDNRCGLKNCCPQYYP